MSYYDIAFIEKPDGTWKLHYNQGGGNWLEISAIPLSSDDNPYNKETP